MPVKSTKETTHCFMASPFIRHDITTRFGGNPTVLSPPREDVLRLMLGVQDYLGRGEQIEEEKRRGGDQDEVRNDQ